MKQVKNVKLTDNIVELVRQINEASWDAENKIEKYDETSLTSYLERQDTIFISCHEITEKESFLLGIGSARIEIKPYCREFWLYVDEVHVCSDHRRKGVGKQMMNELLQIAHDYDCEEIWLATEIDNMPANALYQSLNPTNASQVVGYIYEIKK